MNSYLKCFKKELLNLKTAANVLAESVDSVLDKDFEYNINSGLNNGFLDEIIVEHKIKELESEIAKFRTLINLLEEYHETTTKELEFETMFNELIDGSAKLTDKTIHLKNWHPFNKFETIEIKNY